MSEESKAAANKNCFDKQQAYTDEIIPIMDKLHFACKKHGIPVMIWCIFREDENAVGQGLFMNLNGHGDCAAVAKMGVLGNIADGSLSILDVLKEVMEGGDDE